MKTLYVSDLDGTLLQSDERTSDFTNAAINRLVGSGMLFSYATARSYETARKVTRGLNAKIPLIIYNGAMTVNNKDGSVLSKVSFGQDAQDLLRHLAMQGVSPIVYAFVDGAESFSFLPVPCVPGKAAFLRTREKDPRRRPVKDWESLAKGEIFYITCIDKEEKLAPLYETYRNLYHCVFQVDLYTGAHWLEIMPKAASKSLAAQQLKKALGCEKLVVFGDGKNDMDLFQAADEAYAVENAVEELKALATGVIGTNDEDGVAKWLLEHCVP